MYRNPAALRGLSQNCSLLSTIQEGSDCDVLCDAATVINEYADVREHLQELRNALKMAPLQTTYTLSDIEDILNRINS